MQNTKGAQLCRHFTLQIAGRLRGGFREVSGEPSDRFDDRLHERAADCPEVA